MIITEVNSGKKAGYSVQGTVLTVGTVSIDLQERQTDVQNVIDICLDYQLKEMREGLGAWYVATIIIPPKKRQLVQIDDETYVEQELPLDMNDVELRLWALPAEYNNENNQEEVTE
ncbi:AAA family ATPase [Geobacillus sp. 44C]|nr:AAA family ATPase [Geobacillus sp. 44C]QNU33500.1 AAA family ATPase [Geobacillus sp. 44C]